MNLSGVEDNKNNFGTFAPIKPMYIPTKSAKQMASKELQTVTVPEKPVYDTSLGLFDWITANIFKIKMEGERKMFDAIKTFLLPKLVQWVLKAGGSIFAYIGITKENPSWEEILIGVGAFGASALWSLISTGKIALKNPSEFQKIK